jgi:hypothetical protein
MAHQMEESSPLLHRLQQHPTKAELHLGLQKEAFEIAWRETLGARYSAWISKIT